MHASLVPALVRLAETPPDAEDVVAGPIGLLVILLLIAALVVLSFSLVKQLRKAQAAKDAGVYGDEPVARDDTSTGDPGGEGPVRRPAEGDTPER